ncbi:hypothetical protein [Kitasatospora sp. SUK 42]|uniref:hypothetical protein n=1 Tax=Kitasatospora sp. SUK 42 TaxID=1588882 RepID=UPI0018C93885|nr:hypothetical protein [Kitasatospora sp. SUK 42]MBV2152302.1 hypothetical protein [Kitasatospora sp. SUK 42]
MSDENDIHGADSAFERDLVVRLGARADAVTGAVVPLAGLRAAGARRARRRVAVRGAATLAVFALAAGAVTQLGHGGDGQATAAAGTALTAAGSPADSSGAGPTQSGDYSRVIDTDCARPVPISWTGDDFTRVPSYRLLRLTDSRGAFDLSVRPKQEEHDLVNAIDDLGVKQFPSRLLGYCWDVNAKKVYVKRVPGAGGFDDAVRAKVKASEGVEVAFQDVLHSYAELRAVSEKARADLDYWKSKGLRFLDWEVAADGSGLKIRTFDETQLDEKELVTDFQRKYGPLVIGVWKV